MTSTASVSPAPQHIRALQHANEVRLARADLKRKIASGEMSAREVLVICPWHAANMSISDLLMSQKWWGRTRCRRLLVSVGIPETKRVNALTPRQRKALSALLALSGRA